MAETTAIDVGLKQEKELSPAVRFIRLAGPLIGGLAVLKAVDLAGMALMVPLEHYMPMLPMAMSPQLPVMVSLSHQVAWEIFFPVMLLRLLLADPINYQLGRRGVSFAKVPKWGLDKLINRLEHSNPKVMLALVFGLTLFPLPLANPYMLAGAARTNFKLVMAVDVAATLVFLALIYALGSVFSPLDLVRRCV